MIKKVLVVTIIISLLLSGVGVVVGEVEGENELLEVQEIYDWNDLYDVRDDLDGDYILMNDLDKDMDGYDDYMKRVLTNPEFDGEEGSTPDDWSGSAEIIDEQIDGNNVVEDDSDTGGYLRQDVGDIDESESYTLSFYARKEGTINDGHARLSFYDDSDDYIDEHAIQNDFDTVLTDEWQRFSGTCDDIPENTEYIRVELILGLDTDSDSSVFIHSPRLVEGAGWEPIGVDNDNERFTGTFDGNGHKIADLYINRSGENEVGLFGAVGDGAIIKDVCIADADVTGNRAVGTLIGRVTGTSETEIRRCCAVDGSVVGHDGAVGGLIGSHNSERIFGGNLNDPKLLESFAAVDVSDAGQDNPDKYGGLVGCSQKGTITNSYALGNVTVTGDDAERIGGLAGCLEGNGEFKYTYSTGEVSVTGENPERVGALAGNTDVTEGRERPGEVYYSYSNEETSGQEELVGTIGDGTVEDSELFDDRDNMTGADAEAEENMVEFDFTDPWEIVEETDGDATEDGYPILRNSACDRETQLKAQGIFEEKDIKIWIEEDDAPSGAGKPGDTVEMDSRVYYQATTAVDIVVSLEGDFGEIGVENLAVENYSGDFVYFDEQDSVIILKDHNPEGEESLNHTWKVDIPFGTYPDTYSVTAIYKIGEEGTLSTSSEEEEGDRVMSQNFELFRVEDEDEPPAPGIDLVDDGLSSPYLLSMIPLVIIVVVLIVAFKKNNISKAEDTDDG